MKKFISVTTSFTLTAAAAGQCWALGLGELSLYSHLNEPFSAEIALLEAEGLSEGEMQVGLAPDAEFTRLGMSRDVFLTRINFVVESDAAGKRVVLSTDAPLREPYLDFIVEARWPDGRLLREYTVLVDLPPRGADVLPMPSELGADAPMIPADSALDDLEVTREYDRSAVDEPVPGGRYLTTNSDTLWRIASAVAQQDVSVQQVMLEILAANPDAFLDGNVNGLKSGYVLELPEIEALDGDAVSARAETKRQNEAWAEIAMGDNSGLRLVADADLDDPSKSEGTDLEIEPEITRVEPESSSSELESQDTADSLAKMGTEEELPLVDPLRLDALVAAVGRLETSVAQLQSQLAERDAEITELRAELASQAVNGVPERSPVAIVPAEPREPRAQSELRLPMPSWALAAGAGLVLAGLWALVRRARRQGEALLNADQDSPVPESEGVADAGATADALDPALAAAKVVDEAEVYIAYGRTDQAMEVLWDALSQGVASSDLYLCLMECLVASERTTETAELLAQLEMEADPELVARVRQVAEGIDTNEAHSTEGDESAAQADGAGPEPEPSVLSGLSFSADPSFGRDVADSEAFDGRLDSPDAAAESGGAALAYDADAQKGSETIASHQISGALESDSAEMAPSMDLSTGLESGDGDSIDADGVASASSGLTLQPLAGATVVPRDQADGAEASIYGAETDPVDSKLDLARAYIDMGDDDGARPVLLEAIQQGDLGQQAEARELLRRIEGS